MKANAPFLRTPANFCSWRSLCEQLDSRLQSLLLTLVCLSTSVSQSELRMFAVFSWRKKEACLYCIRSFHFTRIAFLVPLYQTFPEKRKQSCSWNILLFKRNINHGRHRGKPSRERFGEIQGICTNSKRSYSCCRNCKFINKIFLIWIFTARTTVGLSLRVANS